MIMADVLTTFLCKKPSWVDGKFDKCINKNLSLIRRTAIPIPDSYQVSGIGRRTSLTQKHWIDCTAPCPGGAKQQ